MIRQKPLALRTDRSQPAKKEAQDMTSQGSMYEQLSEAIGVENSKILPKLFEMLASEDEAKVLLAASPAASVEELSVKTGIPSVDIEKMIEPLFKKGLIYKSSKPGTHRYYRVRRLLQFHDATILAIGAPPDFLDMWKRYHEEEFPEHQKKIEAALPRPVVRVIPVDSAVTPETQVAPFDDVKQIVDSATNLAVTNCTCKVVTGAPCNTSLEVCIQVNRAADYALERGTGRQLTKQQALDMLKQCQEEGLVHVVGNSRGLGHIICNCCDDCCINWTGSRKAGAKFTAPSRFAAVVDSDLCNGCETCMDRCFFDAIQIDDDMAAIDEEECMGCGLCVSTCPTEAIHLKEAREEAFVPESRAS